MAVSLNKNHSTETITASNEGVKYIFNGVHWKRNDDIIIHRYTDVDINDTGLNPATLSELNYVEISKTYHNDIVYSEALGNSPWKPKNTIVSTSADFFKFPNALSPACLIRSAIGLQGNNYFSLEQSFNSKLVRTYVYSMYVKELPSTVYSQAAITIRDQSYNVVLCAPFDIRQLNDDHAFDADNTATLNIEYRNGMDYKTKYYKTETEIDGSKFFKHCKAKIIKEYMPEYEVYVYKVFVIFNICNNTNFSVGIHLLNQNGEYYYAPTDVVRFYASEAQLEEYPDMFAGKTQQQEEELLDEITPSPYIVTYKSGVQVIRPYQLWNARNGSFVLLRANKIHYLDSVTETFYQNETTGEIYKIIDKSVPTIKNYERNDIAVIQSVITFATQASYKPKTYDTWAKNKLYGVGMRVIYKNNLYECIQAHTSTKNFIDNINKWMIILDGVALGKFNPPDAVDNCIYYDQINGVYRIKQTTDEGDKWLILKYQSSETRRMAMIHAITFGQGKYQTWDEQTNLEVRYTYGFNSGGNYNFFKLNKISSNL